MSFNLLGLSIAQAAPGESQRVPQKGGNSAEIGELPNKLPKTKMELTSKRTKYSTRYLNLDGSFTEQIFAEPQFYQDSTDKKWKKIQNNLKISTKKPGKHENTASDINATFTDQSGNGDLASVEKNGKSLAFVPVGANKVQGVIKGNEITYPALFQDVDVRYHMQGDKMKEDLILNRYTQNIFTYEVKMKGIKASVDKDGQITFADDNGNKQWFLEKPYMTDANGKYSDKVALKLRQEGGKTYIDITADQAFLQDATTKYPVVIDPTVNNWDVQRDMFVASAFPTSSYSSNAYMDTGYNSYFGATRSLVQFYLPALPSDSKITSASFQAYQTQTDATNASIDLYRVTAPWTSATNWNNQPTTAATVESTVTNNTSNAFWQWNITQLAKDWYNGVKANYGFMLKQQNETTSSYRSFSTVNSGTNTPQLIINYTVDPIGVEDFWGYTKDGVNPANGNIVLQSKDLSIPGRGVPVNVTRTYNSRKSNIAGIFGYGWTTNLEARLVDSGSGPITFIDSDNTRHIFGQTAGGGYAAAGGVYLTLVKNADGTYTMTQTDGTKTNFYSDGWIKNIVDPNGNTTSFTYGAAGNLTTITDASGRATTFAYGTNGYVSSVTDPANHTTSYGYDANGNLTTVTDAAGNVTTIAYDSTHNITGIIDARNNKTSISYDASDRVTSISRPITINGTVQTSSTTYAYDPTNLVTSVTDAEGKRVDYTYNANGNVVQVTQNPLDAVNKAVTTYSYDDNNNLTQVIDPNTNSAGGTQAYVYTYDANGNITSKKLPGGQTSYNTYDSQNNLVKEQDYNQNISSSDYDANNNQTESTDPNVQTQAERYDSTGNQLYSTRPMSVADDLIPNSSFEQDINNDNWPDHWAKETSSGTAVTYDWSSTAKFGKKALSISVPGTSGWGVANSDLMPYTSGQTYVVSGYVKTVNTSNTAIVKVAFYDNAGTFLGQQIAYTLVGTHDWTRIQAVVKNPPANTTQIRAAVGLNAGTGTAYFDGVQLEKGTIFSAYNLVDNSSMERDADANNLPDSWTTSNNLSASDGIDSNVNPGDDNVYSGKHAFKMTGESGKNKFITQHINVSGDATTKFTLSGWSKQVGADPNGGHYTLQVALNNTDGTIDWTNAEDFSKTASGWQHVAAEVKPTKTFDSIDVYYYYYNQSGTAWFDAMRLEQGASHTFNTYDAAGNYVTSVKDPNGNTVSSAYDAVGNQTSATDGKGQTTSFTYDARNLLTKVTDSNQGVTAYSYDGAGNRTSVTDANNNVNKYDYNEGNQVSKITNPLNQAIQFGYDKTGNNTSVQYPNGNTVSNTFNALNRMDGIYYNGVKKWGLNYDPNGNVTSVTDAAGNTTSYTYDKNNRLTDQAEGSANKTDYVYDDNGNPTSINVTAGSATISNGYMYDSLDQMTALSRNGVNQADFVYDERGNVISIHRANGTYTAYEYDDANRLKSLKNYNAAGGLLGSYSYTYDANGNQTSVVTDAGTISYQYDALNQLTQETLLDGTTISYTYDAAGNRMAKKVTKSGTTSTTAYTYDAVNQLTAVDGQAYTYDANGNLTGNGSKTFIYNEENQLIQVKDSTGASLATFTYDHEGKRISMTTPSGTTTFHYEDDKVIYETDSSYNITAEYTWDAQGRPVTMTKGGKIYYYHLNGHGDVVSITDANGNLAAQYQYDAWGNITSQTGTMASANPYRYAGYRYDESTKLYYLITRYYDPGVGRFISRDMFHGFENDTISLNQYAYTKNNPVTFVDPDGHYIQVVMTVLAFGLLNALPVFWKYYKADGYSLSRVTGTQWGGIATAFMVGAITKGIGKSVATVTKSFGFNWYQAVTAKASWGIKSYIFNNLSKGINPYNAAVSMYHLLVDNTLALVHRIWH